MRSSKADARSEHAATKLIENTGGRSHGAAFIKHETKQSLSAHIQADKRPSYTTKSAA